MRSRALLLPLLFVPLVIACTAPREPARRSPLWSAQRVLALDLAPRRAAAAGKLPALLGAELGRVHELRVDARAAGRELQRVHAVAERGRTLAADEARRRPAPTRLLPAAHRLGQDVAEALATVWQQAVGVRPLGEIDDREHRTEPADDRPEAGWWQRLRRRLWL